MLQVTPPTSQLHKVPGYERPDGKEQPAAMILGCVDQTDLATASTSAVCMPSVCTYLLLSCSFPSFDLHEVCGVWVIIIFKCNTYRESPLRPSDVEHHNRVIHFPAWSFRLSQFPFHTSSECWRGICFPDCLWS